MQNVVFNKNMIQDRRNTDITYHYFSYYRHPFKLDHHDLVTQKGEAYIYNCPYSSICRQVVIDDIGRIMEFDFDSMDNPRIEVMVRNLDYH